MLSSSQPSCSAPSAGPCTGSTSSSSNNSTCAVFAILPGSDGRTVYQILVCWRCGISGIEAFLLQSQFRWVGHVVRMPNFRIPKQAFFGQLGSRCRLQGGPVRRYKDSLKINLRACDLAPSVLRTAPLDRSVWRQCCSNAISAFEERRTAALVVKRKARKDPVAARGTMMWKNGTETAQQTQGRVRRRPVRATSLDVLPCSLL